MLKYFWLLGLFVATFPLPLRAEPIKLAAENKLIQKVQISGYSSQFADDINQIKAKYDSVSPLSMNELIQLKDDITQFYVGRGYFNSGAYIPEQKITNNQAQIVVLEGSIESINVLGNGRLNESYIRNRLNLSEPVNSDQILDRLYALRKDPLIKGVSAELSEGLSPGKSILDIEVDPAPGFSYFAEFNNYRSPAIGTNSQNVYLSHRNLLGFGDGANFDYSRTSGSDSLNFGYDFPLGRGGLKLAYGFADSDIIEDAFTPLDIETESDFYTLAFTQPIIRKARQDLSLGLAFVRQNSQTTLLDSPFAISRGADEDGNTNLSTLSFYQEYQTQGDSNLLSLRSRFNLGIDVFDAADNESGPDGQYFSWLGQGQFVQSLGSEDTLLVLKSQLQLAADSLVPLEQLRLGGISTVRGFRRDILLGDNGFLSSAEVRLPIWRPGRSSLLQLAPFFDFGTVWNDEDSFALDSTTLASAGMGLRFNLGTLNLAFDYGIPIVGEVEEEAVIFSLGYGN